MVSTMADCNWPPAEQTEQGVLSPLTIWSSWCAWHRPCMVNSSTKSMAWSTVFDQVFIIQPVYSAKTFLSMSQTAYRR